MSIDLGPSSILEEGRGGKKKERKDEKSINGGEDRCEMPSSLRGLDKNAAYAGHASRVEHAVTARGILESSHLLVNWRNLTGFPRLPARENLNARRVSSRSIARAFEKLRIESSSSFGKLAIHLTNSRFFYNFNVNRNDRFEEKSKSSRRH